jgi:RNA polymerase sigma-70 factor, ECF subfamily
MGHRIARSRAYDVMPLDADDIARLYDRHARALLAFLARRTAEPEAAVDLLAETFAAAFRDRRKFRGAADEDALGRLYGIARHQLASYFRCGRVERRALARLGVQRRVLTDAEYDRIEELSASHELRDEVAAALASLTPEHRDAVRLRVVEERPYPEVARSLGISEQTARARVSRALRALRRVHAEEPEHA